MYRTSRTPHLFFQSKTSFVLEATKNRFATQVVLFGVRFGTTKHVRFGSLFLRKFIGLLKNTKTYICDSFKAKVPVQ